MADESTTTTAPPTATNGTTATTAPPAAPWYEGKADLDTIGWLQSKGWDKDAVTAATEAGKAYRQLEKHIGAPADQIIRLPKDAKDEAGWNSVYSRLGKPAAAKDYDLSSVKFADGSPLDDSFVETIRTTAFANHLSKDAATAFASAIVKFTEGRDASEAAEVASKGKAEAETLAKSWGPNAEINKLTAMQAAKRLGVTPEAVNALEGQIGYANVMEMFRKIGEATGEHTFVDGKATNPKTAASAQSRLNDLMADQAWASRLLAGDSAATREFEALTEQISAAA